MADGNARQQLIETFRRWQEVEDEKEGLTLLEYLLRYLTDDENKHLSMLERLAKLDDRL